MPIYYSSKYSKNPGKKPSYKVDYTKSLVQEQLTSKKDDATAYSPSIVAAEISQQEVKNLNNQFDATANDFVNKLESSMPVFPQNDELDSATDDPFVEAGDKIGTHLERVERENHSQQENSTVSLDNVNPSQGGNDHKDSQYHNRYQETNDDLTRSAFASFFSDSVNAQESRFQHQGVEVDRQITKEYVPLEGSREKGFLPADYRQELTTGTNQMASNSHAASTPYITPRRLAFAIIIFAVTILGIAYSNGNLREIFNESSGRVAGIFGLTGGDDIRSEYSDIEPVISKVRSDNSIPQSEKVQVLKVDDVAKARKANPSAFFQELKEGDYVFIFSNKIVSYRPSQDIILKVENYTDTN